MPKIAIIRSRCAYTRGPVAHNAVRCTRACAVWLWAWLWLCVIGWGQVEEWMDAGMAKKGDEINPPPHRSIHLPSFARIVVAP
jgi:hypothetical protein